MLCVVGRNGTILRTLIDTCASGGNFIDKTTAQALCQQEGIQPWKLPNPIALKAFNDADAPDITYSITLPLQVGHHKEDSCELLITNLGHNQMILGIGWMKKHGCVPDPTTGKLIFLAGYCTHPGAPQLSPSITEETEETDETDRTDSESYTDVDSETDSNASIEKPGQKKKRRQPHRRKKTRNQKLREQEQHRISDAKTPFRRSTKCTLPAEVDEDEASEYYDSWEYLDEPASISLIGAYAAKALQDDPENFIALISMRDIMAQHEKEALDEIDPRETLPVQYHEFTDVCSAAAADQLPQHHKRDHHIELESGKKPDWIPRLYRQTWEEQEEVRRWVTENLSKSFIAVSYTHLTLPTKA